MRKVAKNWDKYEKTRVNKKYHPYIASPYRDAFASFGLFLAYKLRSIAVGIVWVVIKHLIRRSA